MECDRLIATSPSHRGCKFSTETQGSPQDFVGDPSVVGNLGIPEIPANPSVVGNLGDP